MFHLVLFFCAVSDLEHSLTMLPGELEAMLWQSVYYCAIGASGLSELRISAFRFLYPLRHPLIWKIYLM